MKKILINQNSFFVNLFFNSLFIFLSFQEIVLAQINSELNSGTPQTLNPSQLLLSEIFEKSFNSNNLDLDLDPHLCEKIVNITNDPSGQEKLFCKAIVRSLDVKLSCDDPNSFVQFHTLCHDLRNYLLDKPCLFSDHNNICSTLKIIEGGKNCSDLPKSIDLKGIVKEGGIGFFKLNDYFSLNQYQVCQSIQHSVKAAQIPHLKENFRNKYFSQEVRAKKQFFSQTFQGETKKLLSGQNLDRKTWIRFKDCRINFSQIIEDQSEGAHLIQGYRFPSQDFLMVDLLKTPLNIDILPESKWGLLNLNINGKKFYFDNPTIFNELIDYAQYCQQRTDKHLIPGIGDESIVPHLPLIKHNKMGDLAPKVSVLEKDFVRTIFKATKNDFKIPYNFAFDHCFTRSFLISKGLYDKFKVEAGQIFVFAPYEKYLQVDCPLTEVISNIRFYFHVAPFIFVKERDEYEMYIIDPTINDLVPQSFNEWISIMTKHDDELNDKNLKFQFSNRFAYGTVGASLFPQFIYNQNDVEEAEKAIDFIREQLGNLQRSKEDEIIECANNKFDFNKVQLPLTDSISNLSKNKFQWWPRKN
jgi:hypothetical protein